LNIKEFGPNLQWIADFDLQTKEWKKWFLSQEPEWPDLIFARV